MNNTHAFKLTVNRKHSNQSKGQRQISQNFTETNETMIYPLCPHRGM